MNFVDLRKFVNTLMLTCTAHPGLSAVFMELLSFDDTAFRSQSAVELGVVGMTVGDLRFRYDKAIVAGAVDTRVMLGSEEPRKDQGIACGTERRITELDEDADE